MNVSGGMSGDESVLGDSGLEPGDEAAGAEPLDTQRLALDDEDRLPWLENGEDDDEYEAVDARRVMTAAAVALLVLAGTVGGVWWATHRHQAGTPVADGSTVPAPPGPYKQAPQNPGGKTYAGTGDTSFAVSQGQNPVEHLADGGNGAAHAAATAGADYARPGGGAQAANSSGAHPSAKPSVGAAPGDASANWNGGIAQIGAFYSQARAETGWTQLSQAHDALSGLKHRVAVGQIDSGTVYRLQVLTAPGAAQALCDRLKAAGLACQVKR